MRIDHIGHDHYRLSDQSTLSPEARKALRSRTRKGSRLDLLELSSPSQKACAGYEWLLHYLGLLDDETVQRRVQRHRTASAESLPEKVLLEAL